MKVKFNNLMSRIKSYNWGKAQMLAKDVLRFGAYSVATVAFSYTFSVIEQQKMLEYKNAVKEADIELYNRINEISESFYGDIFGHGYQTETNSIVLPLVKKAQAMDTKELRFENVDVSFHERLRKGYLELAQKEPTRFAVIDASGTPDEVTSRIIDCLKKFI